jgi:hypothetical protein
MTDDRIVQRLEEQLRDAHAANSELRDRVVEADKASNKPGTSPPTAQLLSCGSRKLMRSRRPQRFGLCYIPAPGPSTFDPACADGFSNVLTLVAAKPLVRYAARVTTYRYLPEVSLRLIARPLGERVPYRVCYRMKNGTARCVSGALDGYDWNSSADDTLSVSTRNLPRITTFTWYASGKKVVSKRVRVR